MFVVLINILLLVAWGFITWYCPVMLCGYGYKDLWSIMNDENASSLASFLQKFNLTDSNITQEATKYFILSIVISVIVFIVICVLCSIFYKYWYTKWFKINKKDKPQ